MKLSEVFLHGLETKESDAGNPRFVATIDSAIIFIVGTAPDAITAATHIINTPYLIKGYDAIPDLGAAGTLPDQLNRIYEQSGRCSPSVVFVIVTAGANAAETITNILGSRANKTGLHALARVESELNVRPKLLCCPGFTSLRPTDAITAIPVTTPGAGYDPLNPPAVTISGAGVGASAEAVVGVNGSITSIKILNGGQGYSSTPTATIAAAPSGGTNAVLGTVAKGTSANPVAMELLSLANRHRAMVVVSGPNTTDEAAVTYRLDFNSDRIYILDPFGKFSVGGVATAMAADAAMLGMQAKVDYEEGFWVSPSNHVMSGLLGTARVVQHSLSDRSVSSQYLNKNHVGTLVRAASGGWKLFGNRVANSDPLHMYWSVRRSHDVMIESVELACEPYLDKAFSKQALIDIAETVNRALRRWTALGATLGGKVWLDPVLNTPESMSAGILYIHYDGEAPAPMEHIVFVFNRNTGYYKTMFDSAAREVARLSSLAA